MKKLLFCIIVCVPLLGCVRDDGPDIKEWRYYSTINEDNSDAIININWEKKKYGEMFSIIKGAAASIYLFEALKLEEGKQKLDETINKTVVLSHQIDKVISFVKEDESLVKTYKVVALKNKELQDLCNNISVCLKKYERERSNQGFTQFCHELDDLHKKIAKKGKEIAELYKNIEAK